VLDLTDEEGVEERFQRKRIGDRRSASEDDRIIAAALLGTQRHTGQIEHLEHIREAQLVRQGERPEIAAGHRAIDSSAQSGTPEARIRSAISGHGQ